MMKNYLFSFLSLFLLTAVSAQIELEHTYPNGSTYNYGQLAMINFEELGWKYVLIDRNQRTVEIFNLDHTLLQTIEIPLSIGEHFDIVYFSQYLFNTNDEIEFMVISTVDNEDTYIIDQNGEILFTELDYAPLVRFNTHAYQYPIYNTSAGTKMILSSVFGNSTKVYSLPGTLTLQIEENNSALIQQSTLTPNPTTNSFSIDYSRFPFDETPDIKIFNQLGQMVHATLIFQNKDFSELNVSNLSSGVYFVQILFNGKVYENKKLIIKD